MNVRKFKSDKNALIAEGNRIVGKCGFEALRPRKKPGRPQRLTGSQKENIKAAVASDPNVYGYTVWDGASLSDYIVSQFGIPLCVRQCQRLLHRLGFSLIRPQTFPCKGNEGSPLRDELKKLRP